MKHHELVAFKLILLFITFFFSSCMHRATQPFQLYPEELPENIFSIFNDAVAYRATGKTGVNFKTEFDLSPLRDSHDNLDQILLFHYSADSLTSMTYEWSDDNIASIVTAGEQYLVFVRPSGRYLDTYYILCQLAKWQSFFHREYGSRFTDDLCHEILCSPEIFHAKELLERFPALKNHATTFKLDGRYVGGWKELGDKCLECTKFKEPKLLYPIEMCRKPASSPIRLNPCVGNTYYVDEHAIQHGKGTADFPFKKIQHAADIAGPCDTVVVKSGTYREFIVTNNSGNVNAPIIYKADPQNEKPVIIKGSDMVKGWEKTTIPSCAPNKVYVKKILKQGYLFSCGDKVIQEELARHQMSKLIDEFKKQDIQLSSQCTLEPRKGDKIILEWSIHDIKNHRTFYLDTRDDCIKVYHFTFEPSQQSNLTLDQWKVAVTNDIQQIFQRDAPLGDALYLERVENIADMSLPGTFTQETSGHHIELYVCLHNNEEPNSMNNGNGIEIATRRYIFFTNFSDTRKYQQHIKVKGFQFRHTSNPKSQWSSVSIAGAHNLLENCIISWMDFSGVSIIGVSDTLRNNIIAYNGNHGISGAGENHFFSKNRTLHNNWRRWDTNWVAGGAKFIGPYFRPDGTKNSHLWNSIIEEHESAFNFGPGLWIDGGGNNYIERCLLHENEGAGLMLEASKDNIAINIIAYRNKVRSAGKLVVVDSDLIKKRQLEITQIPYKSPNIWQGNGIFLRAAEGSKIYHCLFYMNESAGISAHDYHYAKINGTAPICETITIEPSLDQVARIIQKTFSIQHLKIDVCKIAQSSPLTWLAQDAMTRESYCAEWKNGKLCCYRINLYATRGIDIKNNIFAYNQQTQLVLEYPPLENFPEASPKYKELESKLWLFDQNQSDYNIFCTRRGQPIIKRFMLPGNPVYHYLQSYKITERTLDVLRNKNYSTSQIRLLESIKNIEIHDKIIFKEWVEQKTKGHSMHIKDILQYAQNGWQHVDSQNDQHSIQANPHFVSDILFNFHLTAQSPARGAGICIADSIAPHAYIDFDALVRQQPNVDIGPYED